MSVKEIFKGKELRGLIAKLLYLELSPEREYKLEIKEHRKKRSLDANAYCWALIGHMSDKLNIPPVEIYQEYILCSNCYEVVPIRQNVVKRWCEEWENRGDGYLTVDIGESKHTGYENIRCYFGSSSFDTKEMSRFLDEIVADCRELGIETATERELSLLKEEWK